MKKVLFVLGVVTVLASCGGSTTETEVKTDSTAVVVDSTKTCCDSTKVDSTKVVDTVTKVK
jgi:hypothetical protein